MNFRSLRVPARHAPASLFVMALSLLPGLWKGAYATSQPQAASPDTTQVQQALQGLAMPFEANSGQFDERVAFVGRSFAGSVYVTREGQIVYSLPGAKAQSQEARPGWSLTETLVDARSLKPYGGEQASTKVNRFTGPSSYEAATYRNVYLGQAWPGIEVELAASAKGGSNVEKLFHVKPYADVERIQVRLDGAESLRLGEGGELIVATGNGDVAYTAPIAFQQVGGKRFDVPVKYVLNEAGDGYSFALGMYDRTRPLVIDPLLQSTYLGGGNSDYILALSIDAATGDVVVAGYADSSNFPGTAGGVQPGFAGGSYDGFVARLSGDLKTLRQSSYLGGPDSDVATSLAIDPATGDVLVGGRTESGGFPGATGGAQPGNQGGRDGFVARLSGDLKTLLQSTYLGGQAGDSVASLAVDAATGDVLVAGYTQSLNLPAVSGGAQPGFGGGTQDAFVARLSGDLTALRQSTFLGGRSTDFIAALAIDTATGDVLVAGETESSNFPGTAGGTQPGYGGGQTDGFVARLSGDLTALRQSTYLGGSAYDSAAALAIDAATGDVLVAGTTYFRDFPGTAGGAQPSSGGGVDGFVARLSGDLTVLRQSTYLGSSATEYALALTIDPATGDVLAAGYTGSSDFPGVAGGARPVFGGSYDAFVSRLSGGLTVLRQSTYLGGTNTDVAQALALDAATGDVLVAGYTRGAFSDTTGGAQPGYGGGYSDGFVARVTDDLKATSPQAITFPSQANQEFAAGGRFAIDPPAMARSGLPVSYASSTPAVCTVSGDVVTMISTGTCTVVARQGGNTQWKPAADVAVDIAIEPPPAAQNITFPPQAQHEFVAGASFAIDPAATASSGLPVSYASTTPDVCTVSGNTVTMVSAGTCTVVASQGGNAQWEPAQDTVQHIVLVPVDGNGGGNGNGGTDPDPDPDPGPGPGPGPGPDPVRPTPVPTLGPLGLALMSLLAGGMGWLRLRRR